MLKESEAFRKAIKKIDKMSLRLTQIIPILYAKNIEDLSYETNYLTDDYFNNFLTSLGISLDKDWQLQPIYRRHKFGY